MVGILVRGQLCMRGSGDVWEISVAFSQFCCEPKTALKNKWLKMTINFYNLGLWESEVGTSLARGFWLMVSCKSCGQGISQGLHHLKVGLGLEDHSHRWLLTWLANCGMYGAGILNLFPCGPCQRANWVTWWYGSSDPGGCNLEAVGSFRTWPRKAHAITHAISCWLHTSALVTVGGDHSWTWIPRGRNE